MLQGALYILAGASLYAGSQRLCTDIRLHRSLADKLFTPMFFLLAATAATTAFGLSATTAMLVTPGIVSGTLLWCLLPWLSAGFAGVRAGLATDMLSAAWIAALIGQLVYPQNSLGRFWGGVSWLMLLTLAHSMIMVAWQLWPVRKPPARRYLSGLLLLAAASLAGIPIGSLAFPFGFLLFLLLTASCRRVPEVPGPVPALAHMPARILNLNFDRPAGETQRPEPVRHQTTARPAPERTIEPDSATRVKIPEPASRPRADRQQREMLIGLADDLIDISVYATMALRRLSKDQADLKLPGALLRRIRSRAIASHREAIQLSQPEDITSHREPDRQNRLRTPQKTALAPDRGQAPLD